MSKELATIDTAKVDAVLATLSDEKTIKDIMNEGLEQMAEVYYQTIVGSLRKEMGSAADTAGINGKWLFPLSQGIEIHPDEDNVTYGVHAFTDFRLRFFEGGTKQRFTKGHKITGRTKKNRLKRSGKGGYRGMITANYFFTKGVSQAEKPAMNALITSVINAIRNRGIDIK